MRLLALFFAISTIALIGCDTGQVVDSQATDSPPQSTKFYSYLNIRDRDSTDSDSSDTGPAPSCVTCILPPSDGGGGGCTQVNNTYDVSATVNNLSISTQSDAITTHKLSAFFGELVIESEKAIQEEEIDELSIGWKTTPFATGASLKPEIEVSTAINADGTVDISASLFDFLTDARYSSTSMWTRTLKIETWAQEAEVRLTFDLQSQEFTDYDLNLVDPGVSVSEGGIAFSVYDWFKRITGGTSTSTEASERFVDQIEGVVEGVNPNAFTHMLLNDEGIEIALGALGFAIELLLEDDVSADLSLRLPICQDGALAPDNGALDLTVNAPSNLVNTYSDGF